MSSLQWDGKNWTSPLHKRKSLILRLRREDGPKAQHHCAPSQCWCHSTDSKSLLSARTWHLDGIWRDSSLKSFETHSRDLSQIWGPTSWAQSSNIFCQFFSRSAQVQVCENKLSSLQLFFLCFSDDLTLNPAGFTNPSPTIGSWQIIHNAKLRATMPSRRTFKGRAWGGKTRNGTKTPQFGCPMVVGLQLLKKLKKKTQLAGTS